MIYSILALEAPYQEILLDIYLNQYRQLIRYAQSIVHEKHQAEDIVQGIFMKLIEKPQLLKHEAAQRNLPYLYVMVRNRCLNQLRDHRKVVEIDHFAEIATEAPLDFADFFQTKEKYLAALEAIANLPDLHKDVLVLRYLADYSDQEISELLDTNPVNVRKRISNALKKVRRELEDEHDAN